MNGCIYRTEENKCKQFSVGGVTSFCYLDGTCDCKIPSNADRIRAMTDEELAFLIGNGCPPTCVKSCREYLNAEGDTNCTDCWLDWLKAPADKEGEG